MDYDAQEPNLVNENYDYESNENNSLLTNYTNENSGEDLPEPLHLQSLHVRNGTNMKSFTLRDLGAEKKLNKVRTNLSFILYILLAVAVLIVLIIGVALLAWRYYKTRRKTEDVVVVKSLKNEREECRRRDRESWGDRLSGISSPVTLNSESNIQTVKVKTLAITVRNNLDEEGTEV